MAANWPIEKNKVLCICIWSTTSKATNRQPAAKPAIRECGSKRGQRARPIPSFSLEGIGNVFSTANELTSLGKVGLSPPSFAVIAKSRRSQEEGEELFREMLKWLYLCYRYAADDLPHGFACSMTPEILKIDEMWHCFVLHTRDYADFCETNFGFFLHHEPQGDDGPAPELDDIEAQLTEQLTFMHYVLGADTLRAWYEECRYALSE